MMLGTFRAECLAQVWMLSTDYAWVVGAADMMRPQTAAEHRRQLKCDFGVQTIVAPLPKAWLHRSQVQLGASRTMQPDQTVEPETQSDA